MVSRDEVELLLKSQHEAFKETLNFMVSSYSSKIDYISTELQQVKSELSLVKQQSEIKDKLIEDISHKIDDLEVVVEGNRFDSKPVFERLDSLEDHSRRNNLRFSGIEELPNENWEQTAELVKKLVKNKLEFPENFEVERAHRVGIRSSNKPRTIIAKFLRFQDRQKILRTSSKLKGTKIFVNEDLCEESLKKRKEKLPQLQQARREGKVAYFNHTTLIIKENPNSSTRRHTSQTEISSNPGQTQPSSSSIENSLDTGDSSSPSQTLPSGNRTNSSNSSNLGHLQHSGNATGGRPKTSGSTYGLRTATTVNKPAKIPKTRKN